MWLGFVLACCGAPIRGAGFWRISTRDPRGRHARPFRGLLEYGGGGAKTNTTELFVLVFVSSLLDSRDDDGGRGASRSPPAPYQVNERPSDLYGKSNFTAFALFKAVSGFTFRSMLISACEMTAHTFSSWGSDLELAAVYFFETK